MDALPPRRDRLYPFLAVLLSTAVRVTTDLRVVGSRHLPRRGPALLVANHVSFMDPVVLLVLVHRAGRPLRVLAVEEAFTRPLSGWWMRAGGHIPVPRGRAKLSALRAAGAALDAGELVLIYPEGTIAADTDPDVRAGVGFLLARHDVPVVPVGTAGLERGAHGLWLRRPAAVVIGRPQRVSRPGAGRARRGWYDSVAAQLMERVRELVAAARGLVTARRGGAAARDGRRR